jgi:hypothetical protein
MEVPVVTDSIYGYQIVAHDHQVDIVWADNPPGQVMQMVAHQVRSPSLLPAGAGATLTIAGINFSETPRVTVGEMALTHVRWLDEHTLTADLPDSLPPGIYPLSITNPTGETMSSLSAIWIGEPHWLPVVMN